MIGFVVGVLAALVLVVAARSVARALPPVAAVAVTTITGLVAMAIWLGNMALLSSMLVGRVPALAALGHWSGKGLAAHDAAPVWVSATACAVLVEALAGVGALALRAWPSAQSMWLLAKHSPACTSDGFSVVRSDRAFAVALPGWPGSPGWPGQVVVSSAMLRVLQPDEREAVMAHERCHLRCGHYLCRWLVRASAALFPPAIALVGECDFALERWADESAARSVGDRALVARALARAALAGQPAAFPGAMAFPRHAVTRRVHELLAKPLPMRWGGIVALGALCLVAMAAATLAAHETEVAFELAKRLLA